MVNWKQSLLIYLTVCISLCSCKKIVEEQQKNAFLAIMTGGYWHVESYNEGTINSTELFQGYSFKFEQDGTVNGINGNNTISGTWIGDIENYTITSNFPVADDPLKRLNGMWKITSTKIDFVRAEMTTDKGKMLLELRKS